MPVAEPPMPVIFSAKTLMPVKHLLCDAEESDAQTTLSLRFALGTTVVVTQRIPVNMSIDRLAS
eukprot:2948652-Heterocapsa_arctica.AAC.1